jgi:hypothetical protein
MSSIGEIFLLIHSLSKSEKRYIKLHSGKETGVIISMFNSIDKFRGNNEKDFKLKNKHEKFIKNYAYNKYYLYNFVIKKLAEYNTEKSVDAKIHNMIMECKILFAKALYRQYFKSIQKAKEFALKHERHGYFLQILDMEKIIIKKEEIQTNKGKAIYDEAMNSLNHMKNSFELSRLSNILLSEFRQRGVKRNESHELDIEEMLENKLAEGFDRLASKEKEAFYRVREIAYEMQGDYLNTYKMQINRLNVIRENPYAFMDNIINHELDTISSLLTSTIRLNKTEETVDLLNEYRSKTKKTPSDIGDYEIMEPLIMFLVKMERNELREAKKYIPVLNGILIKYHNKMLIDTELTMRYYIVVFYILTEDFNNALKYSNILLNHPLIEKREDYLSYLKILILLIHFELNNLKLLGYLIKSTYRFLYKRNKLYGLEYLIMDFLRKLPEIKNEDDLKFSLIQLKRKMESLKTDPYEKNAFVYFDFFKWLEVKIQKLTV